MFDFNGDVTLLSSFRGELALLSGFNGELLRTSVFLQGAMAIKTAVPIRQKTLA